jgi:hypothetical protein
MEEDEDDVDEEVDEDDKADDGEDACMIPSARETKTSI